MCHEVLQEGENVKIMDAYDDAIVNIGWIHSLYVFHGVTLGPEDANVNAINATSNIPIPYEIN